ncbi:hypothetical protein ENSA5_46210 [Enhygromyxa salina]|uniref:DUF3160 domain-containing protein n=1 Tax=Enhygromyxa salina TaxID=215803 RepID=A0A2S9XJB9_9BACT|nr:DUF3160 domain-containing protein [Enhygromyxa salina]PRP92953.1 hypothetical protein ENSA5_46210 [Enhygromyxa salina]
MPAPFADIRSRLLLVALAATPACVDAPPSPDVLDDPRCFGANAEAALADGASFDSVWSKVREAGAAMEPATFEACHAGEESLASVAYDVTSADYLDVIEGELGFSADQAELLANNGFVVLDHQRHRTFEAAYSSLYAADLPVLVTSDSLLYALHRSFDRILMELELAVLQGEVELMLSEMHSALAELAVPPELGPAARDLDVYLAVARSLLTQDMTPQPTITGAEADEQVAAILDDVAAEQLATLDLFGASADYDYSQLQPRGHYVGPLEPYFRALMWIGRTQMPLIDSTKGEARLNRRGLEAAVLTGELLDQGPRARWDRVELVLRQLIGEPDSMSPATLDLYRADAGLGDLQALAAADDAELQAALLAGEYGVQRIMSQVISTQAHAAQVELPQVFSLLGQRFAVDSQVMHAVTFDRLRDPQTGAKTLRMLPHEFDVAFALGSKLAGELLADELDTYGYQGVLHELRFLIDAHPDSFWRESVYNGWLHALRGLDAPTEQADYPAAMQTEAWRRKTLNTQLASWAELRHDTILYTKQSYTSAISCEYPQAYVEPVPTFYARMAEVAAQGVSLAATLASQGHPVPEVEAYFEHMAYVMGRLESIASKELDGVALDEDEWEFLRATIEAEKVGCANELRYDGWYGGLLYSVEDHGDFRPTIADIHTAPTDAEGRSVGWVLHAATGYARSMVFTVEDCGGVRAYVGPVSTYHRKLTEGLERLDDGQWATELDQSPPEPPEWTRAFAR